MTQSPAYWYPDPLGRYELRYWDGEQWTDHVATQGVQAVDPLAAALAQQAAEQAAQRARAAVVRGGGTVFTEPVLRVTRRGASGDLISEYVVADHAGRQLASVREVRQAGAKKALRLPRSVDQLLTHPLEVTDVRGEVVLRITRPGRLVKSRLLVQDGEGQEIGQIVRQNVWGKMRFSLEAAGRQYGALNADEGPEQDLDIQDDSGEEVARISRSAHGYVVHIHRPREDPLRTLLVAAALAIETALKPHDDRAG